MNTEISKAKERNTEIEFERKEQGSLSQKVTSLERSPDGHLLENQLSKVTRTYKYVQKNH